jgi:hypothetical protein
MLQISNKLYFDVSKFLIATGMVRDLMVKIKLSILVLVGLVLFSSGCSSVKIAEEQFKTKALLGKTAPDKGNLYVYRNWKYVGHNSATAHLVDGKPVGLLETKTFLIVSLPPGNHELSVSFDRSNEFGGLMKRRKKITKLNVNIVANQNYFVKEELAKDGFVDFKIELTPSDKKKSFSTIQNYELVDFQKNNLHLYERDWPEEHASTIIAPDVNSMKKAALKIVNLTCENSWNKLEKGMSCNEVMGLFKLDDTFYVKSCGKSSHSEIKINKGTQKNTLSFWNDNLSSWSTSEC